MKPSEVIKEMQKWINVNGDNDIYILSKIDGKGTHLGNIISIGGDAECGIIIETNIGSESCTK